nr:DUF973 family protein [Sulfuracidifex tepidarius]
MSYNPNPSLEIDGIEKLRRGTLFFIIIPLLSLLSIALAVTVVGPIVLSIIAIVLGILGLLRIREGFSLLVQSGKPVGIARRG